MGNGTLAVTTIYDTYEPPTDGDARTAAPDVAARGIHYRTNMSLQPPTTDRSVAGSPRSSRIVGGMVVDAATETSAAYMGNEFSDDLGGTVT